MLLSPIQDIGGMKLAIEMVRGDKRDRDRGGRDSWRGGDRDRSRRRSRSPIRGRRRSPNRCGLYIYYSHFGEFLTFEYTRMLNS
jgi:hypothetical protein